MTFVWFFRFELNFCLFSVGNNTKKERQKKRVRQSQRRHSISSIIAIAQHSRDKKNKNQLQNFISINPIYCFLSFYEWIAAKLKCYWTVNFVLDSEKLCWLWIIDGKEVWQSCCKVSADRFLPSVMNLIFFEKFMVMWMEL